jgi:hypothetical protein
MFSRGFERAPEARFDPFATIVAIGSDEAQSDPSVAGR